MKNLLLGACILCALALPAIAQEMKNEKKATDADKIATFDDNGEIKRGAAIGDSSEVALADVLREPSAFAGKTVKVSGFIVRSCKMEGCWAELGAEPDSKQTVRVTMKDHSFFIPLKSAGFRALAEGVFTVETLSKEKVKHLMEEDGAKFDNMNEDGTVTEVAFLASGIVLTRE